MVPKLTEALYTTVVTQMLALKAYKEMGRAAIEAMYAESAQLLLLLLFKMNTTLTRL